MKSQMRVTWTSEPERRSTSGSDHGHRARTDGLAHSRHGAVERRHAGPGRWLVARRQLPVGRADLPAEQPPAAHAAVARRRQAASARALGHHARAELHLRPPQPSDPRARATHDVRHRPRPRRSGTRCQRLPRRHLFRGLLRRHPRRGGHAATVPAVLVPRRHPVARRTRDARLDPRGRRTRLCALPRLRRRLRQPRPAGRGGGG